MDRFQYGRPGRSWRFYLRSLNELEPRLVKDVPGAGAFFSPDGLWVGFLQLQSGGIRKLALSGGAPATICHTDQFIGATWGDDDNVYFVADFPAG